MRKLIFAAVAVALCPMLLHAQAILPAHPGSTDAKTVLVSGLDAPKAPPSAIPDKAPLRVSTGITTPRLITSSQVHERSNWNWTPGESSRVAVVGLIVDPSGNATHVRVLRSLGPEMDNDILAAVSHYHFEPGTLNNESTPMEVELTLQIHNRLQ